MIKRILLPLLLLSSSFSSLANERPIDEMFRVMQMDKQFAVGFDAMSPMLDQLAVQLKLTEQQKSELRAILKTWFDEDIDHEMLANETKSAYQSHFSDDEIQQITQFYKSPVGKKLLDKSPELMSFGAEMGMREAQAKQAQLMERLKPFLQKHKVK